VEKGGIGGEGEFFQKLTRIKPRSN